MEFLMDFYDGIYNAIDKIKRPFRIFGRVIDYIKGIRNEDGTSIFGRKMPTKQEEIKTQPSELTDETRREEKENLGEVVEKSQYSPFCRLDIRTIQPDGKNVERPTSNLKEGYVPPCQPFGGS